MINTRTEPSHHNSCYRNLIWTGRGDGGLERKWFTEIDSTAEFQLHFSIFVSNSRP